MDPVVYELLVDQLQAEDRDAAADRARSFAYR